MFIDDAVAALVAAIARPEAPGPSVVVAGPEPISYADMVRACATVLDRRVTILPVPAALLVAGARAATAVGFKTPFSADEIMRATEDNRFDVGPLETRLGVTPRPFDEGLRLKLERGWCPCSSGR